MTGQIDEQKLIDVLKAAHADLRLIVMFGSMAQGRARFDSDVDLGVLGDKPIGARDRFEMGRAVVQELNWPAHIVDLHDVPQPITGEVLRGKRLYGTDECFAQVCSRHLIEREGIGRAREQIVGQRVGAWLRG